MTNHFMLSTSECIGSDLLLDEQTLSVTMTTGMSIRSGVIGSIFRKSLRLSGKARLQHSVGQITTMISTDATRLDRSSAFAHK